MKRILISMVFLLIILSACNSVDTKSNNEKTDSNYYLSMSNESEHWKVSGYEIVLTSDGYKAGNGILKMKDEEKQKEGFLSYDVYAIVGGEEDRLHGGSVSGDADITRMLTGTANGEEERLKEFPEVEEIYMNVTWNDDDTDGDQKEKIVLYNKDKNDDSFLESE